MRSRWLSAVSSSRATVCRVSTTRVVGVAQVDKEQEVTNKQFPDLQHHSSGDEAPAGQAARSSRGLHTAVAIAFARENISGQPMQSQLIDSAER